MRRGTITGASWSALYDRAAVLAEDGAREEWPGEADAIDNEIECRKLDAADPANQPDYDEQDRRAASEERLDNLRREQ